MPTNGTQPETVLKRLSSLLAHFSYLQSLPSSFFQKVSVLAMRSKAKTAQSLCNLTQHIRLPLLRTTVSTNASQAANASVTDKKKLLDLLQCVS